MNGNRLEFCAMTNFLNRIVSFLRMWLTVEDSLTFQRNPNLISEFQKFVDDWVRPEDPSIGDQLTKTIQSKVLSIQVFKLQKPSNRLDFDISSHLC
jgi:hypothetical protein